MLFADKQHAQAALTQNWHWPHFAVDELACRCGGRFCNGCYWHDARLLDGLETIREAAGAPVIITSGHRCPQWNAAIGGAPMSYHKRMAVDMSLRDHDRMQILQYALAAGFTGLGLAKTFLHMDMRPCPARWFYKGSRKLWPI